MNKVARQLCEDIVEPALPGQTSSHGRKPVHLVAHQYPTRKIVIDKEKKVVEIDPLKLKGVTKFKSKGRILDKEYNDKSVNTVVTGSLKDVINYNNTATVRTKDRGPCKCGMKHTCKIPKRLQDKETTQEVTTFSRATQFLDCVVVKNMDPQPRQPQHTGTQTVAFTRIEAGNQVFMSDVFWSPLASAFVRKTPVTKPNPRVFKDVMPRTPLRWAVTRHPMSYGPDF